MRRCRHCHEPISGRPFATSFCGEAHYRRARRRRAAGVPVDAYREAKGARRGRVALSALTQLERAYAAGKSAGRREVAAELRPKAARDDATIEKFRRTIHDLHSQLREQTRPRRTAEGRTIR